MSLLTGLSRLFGGSRPKPGPTRPANTAHASKAAGTASSSNGVAARNGTAARGAPVVIEIDDDTAEFKVASGDGSVSGARSDAVVVEPKAARDQRTTVIDADTRMDESPTDLDPDEMVSDIADDLPDATRSRFLPVVRSKQDLINDLQKRYTEVVELIQKVDTHLDEQSKRQERLLEIAETVPDALAKLPEMHAQTARLTHAIEQLTEATVRGVNRNDAAMTKQKAALDQLVTHAADSAHTQTKVVGSLAGLAEGVTHMHEAGTQMSAAMTELGKHESTRDAAITAAVKDQRRMTSIAAAASIAAALSVVALVILIATGTV
jgi:hypothetical protein